MALAPLADEELLLADEEVSDAGPRSPSAASRRGPRGRAQAGLVATLVGGALALTISGRWAPELVARVRQTASSAAGGPRLSADLRGTIGESTAESECVGPHLDCRASKCCTTPGFQCFKKNKGWAACRATCVKGPDPTDENPTPWDCESLGPKAHGHPPPTDFSVQAAPWVATKCSGSGENCNTTLCCKEAGAQCFVKQKGWAACKAECTRGVDPTDVDNHPWTCETLGMRTPGPPSKSLGVAQSWVAENCSAGGENCKDTGCCKEAGKQCFMKDNVWSSCWDRCVPGPILTDKNPESWNCTPLGGRTPGIPKTMPHLKLAPWVKTHCGKPAENCNEVRCCTDSTMQCYQKDEQWASCMHGCTPGPLAGDKSGGNWSCKTLGPRTPRPWGYPSLYCFSVCMLSSYEAGIMRQALRVNGGIGIFGCDLYDVFSQDGETWLGDGPNGPVRTRHFIPAAVTVSVDGTAGNSRLFMNVWEAVKTSGAWAMADWTVKADPDAVMFADRLRTHLKGHTGWANFIVNCNKQMFTGPMMFGSVEALSQGALQKYFDSGPACHKNFQYGEDRWLGECLKELGVGSTMDFTLVGDNVCTGANCADGKAAYHPFKNEAAWLGCYNMAMR